MRTGVLPESRYHIDLLRGNGVNADILFIKAGSMLVGNPAVSASNYRVIQTEKYGGGIISTRKANASIYSAIERMILNEEFHRFILFGDAKPHHKFIIDVCLRNGIAVELWEDGLGYYIGTGAPVKFAIRSFAKLLYGSYPHGIFSERYKRDEILTRDRFLKKNLSFSVPACSPDREIGRVAFIGQPLVEDGYIGKARYEAKVEALSIAAGGMVDYFPHPREVDKIFDPEKVSVRRCESTEEYLSRNRYRYCLSAFSTALINLPDFQNKVICAKHFGFRHVYKSIKHVSIPHLHVADDLSFLK